jgi:8-oxo-dGTP diphosphatase
MMSYIAWLRGKVGHQKIIVVYAPLALRDDQDRVLLQLRADTHIWGLPGGVMEPGESILEAARRELFEETGLLAGDLRLVGIYTDPRYDSAYPNGDQVQQFNILFEGHLQGGRMQAQEGETSDLAFFAPQDIPFEGMPNFYVDMLHGVLRGGGPSFEPPSAAPRLESNINRVRGCIGHEVYVAAGAMVAVLDERGRLLVERRVDDGWWSLPGGFTDLGENAAHTALREVLEETNLLVQPERLLGISSQVQPWAYPNGDRTQSVIAVFQARPQAGLDQAQPRPDHQETSQLAWMTPQEVLALEVHPILAKMNRAVVEALESGTPFVLS